MTELLKKLFLKNTDVSTPGGRERYGRLSGIVGIICNALLCACKISIGVITSSIAIMADGINNLSDAGSSIITLIGFRLSGKAADDDHPFGHARMEYITALIVSVIILFIGFDLGKSSVEKIISPETINISTISLAILAGSILVKLWMMLFNNKLSKEINSSALKATAQDSRNDAIATFAVLIASCISYFFNINLDGYMGVLVSLFIMWSGIGLIRETVGTLLGESADADMVKNLRKKILSYEGVLGVHDFMVHSYGPGIYFASAHIEMDANEDMLHCHDVLDTIENDIKAQMNITIVLHLDPLVTDDERTNEMRKTVLQILEKMEGNITMHDFRIVTGIEAQNVVFDIVVPRNYLMTDSQVKSYLTREINKHSAVKTGTVITVDHDFVSKN